MHCARNTLQVTAYIPKIAVGGTWTCEQPYALTLLNVLFPLRFFRWCFEKRIASRSFAFLIIEHAFLKEDKNRSFSFSRLVKQPKSSWRIPSGNFIIGAIISLGKGKMEDVSIAGVGFEI